MCAADDAADPIASLPCAAGPRSSAGAHPFTAAACSGGRTRPDGRVPLVILVSPPVTDFALFDLFIRPYGLLRLGRAFVNAGYRIALLDCLDPSDPASRRALGAPRRKPNGTGKLFRQPMAKPGPLADAPRRYYRYGMLEESAAARLRRLCPPSGRRPDLLLVSTGMTYWYPGAQEACRLVRRLFPGVPLAVGGIYATLCPEHCRAALEPDYVVPGEALPKLNRILRSLSLPELADGLSENPLPLPEVFSQAAVIRLNRGCPFRCGYCASGVLSGGFFPGDPDDLFGVIAGIHGELGTRNFAFYDDALLAGKEAGFLPLLERLADAEMALSFFLPNALHLAGIDERTARLMKRTGFREVRLGFESSDEAFHRRTGGKLEVDMLEGGMDALRAAGFAGQEITAYVLAGLPGQAWQEVEASVRFAAALGIRVSVAEYSPVPGTGLWPESLRRSRYPLEEPLTHNNSILPLQWEGFTPADLQHLKDLARATRKRRDSGR